MRKQAKTYGTCRLAEGGELEGQRLCIVEDVVTSGGAILDAAVELRAAGAVLGPVVCVIDRESGGAEKLAAEGLELHAAVPRCTSSTAVAASAGHDLHAARRSSERPLGLQLGRRSASPRAPSRVVAEASGVMRSTTHFAAAARRPRRTRAGACSEPAS